MAKKNIELTETQLKELHKLARAQKYAEDAKEIRKRFKAFVEDNQADLAEGLEVDGMKLGVKVSLQLTVEEAS